MSAAVEASHPLDNPAWASLIGRHAHLGLRSGAAARYRGDVSRIAALAESTAAALEDLAKIVEPGEHVLVMRADEIDPPGSSWQLADSLPLLQMVLRAPLAAPDLSLEKLGEEDADDAVALVALTEPGPFERGTLEMGRYLGLRDEGRLVAMAGERMKPPGHTEISAVCTHPDWQGRGLGEAFVRAAAAAIQADGDVPFLHVYAGNERAIALYERLGFEARVRPRIGVLVRQ